MEETHYELLLKNDPKLLGYKQDFEKEKQRLTDNLNSQQIRAAEGTLNFSRLPIDDSRNVEQQRQAAQKVYDSGTAQAEKLFEQQEQTRIKEIQEDHPELYKEYKERKEKERQKETGQHQAQQERVSEKSQSIHQQDGTEKLDTYQGNAKEITGKDIAHSVNDPKEERSNKLQENTRDVTGQEKTTLTKQQRIEKEKAAFRENKEMTRQREQSRQRDGRGR